MPNINQMKQSKFLKKEDCGPNGILVTLSSVSEMNVALPSAPEEYKWCAHFVEVELPLVLNSTNLQIMAAVFGSEETDEWTGKKIVLYNDPNVSYAGKLTGGIRCRAPRGRAAAQAAPVRNAPAVAAPIRPAVAQHPTPVPEPQPESDDVPF